MVSLSWLTKQRQIDVRDDGGKGKGRMKGVKGRKGLAKGDVLRFIGVKGDD